MRIASSRSGTSIIANPPTCSFDSMNGPSDTRMVPFTRRTVVAVRLGCSSTPPLRMPLCSRSSDQRVMSAYTAATSSFGRSRNDSSFTNINTYVAIFVSLPFADRPDLDAVARPRLRERDGFVLARQLQDGEAANGFLRLDERAVDHNSLVAARADRRRRTCRLQLRTAVGDLRAVRLEPLEDVGVDLLLLGRW